MKSDDDGATIIPFPISRENRQSSPLPDKILISGEAAHALMIAVSAINMAARYKGEFDENCKQCLDAGNFPCGENCGCYFHMLSSMALEIAFDGVRKDEAREALRQEYATLSREGPKKKGDL